VLRGFMSDVVDLTQDAVQITDGSNGAHVTVSKGGIQYADSADSVGWHTLSGTILEVRPPVVTYMKAIAAGGAEIVVTKWSENS